MSNADKFMQIMERNFMALDYPTVEAVADAVKEWLAAPEQAEFFTDEDLVAYIRSLAS